MNRDDIRNKVIEVAEKYRAANTQQIKQLSLVLKKCDPEEVFFGLYSVFLISGENSYIKQQLAGVLLSKVRPRLFINLSEVIKDCLDTWNVSVEELPHYLRDLCGLNRVAEAIGKVRLTNLNQNEIQRLNTIEYWLGLNKNG